jgi:thiol:disulfide interchange protein DsbD
MKALALVQSGERPAQMRRDGLFYAAGVILSFAAIAGLLIGLKSAGAAIGWGFQLQSPLLILILYLLTAAIGLNLLGLFDVPLSLAGIGGHLAGESGLGAFFTGVLAVLVASPCTAPFMGAALGYAMTQPAIIAAAVFLSLGFGFAAPLAAFTFIPGVARLIPRPGPWMVRLKEALAFPMLGTAIWLLWVLEQQTGANGIVFALGIGLGIVFLFWLMAVIGHPVARWLMVLAGVVGLGVAAMRLQPAVATNAPASGQWGRWSPGAVAAARAAGHPVLVDFSAAWCVTCLVNEHMVLENADVERLIARDNVITLKGDWTSRSAAIAHVLARYGRAGVPLYLIYPANPGASPQVLPQLLTPDVVTAALSRAVHHRS